MGRAPTRRWGAAGRALRPEGGPAPTATMLWQQPPARQGSMPGAGHPATKSCGPWLPPTCPLQAILDGSLPAPECMQQLYAALDKVGAAARPRCNLASGGALRGRCRCRSGAARGCLALCDLPPAWPLLPFMAALPPAAPCCSRRPCLPPPTCCRSSMSSLPLLPGRRRRPESGSRRALATHHPCLLMCHIRFALRAFVPSFGPTVSLSNACSANGNPCATNSLLKASTPPVSRLFFLTRASRL